MATVGVTPKLVPFDPPWSRWSIVIGPLRTPGGEHGDYTPWRMEENIRHAQHLAAILWRAGHAVLCPHLNTQRFDGIGVPATAFIDAHKAFLRAIPPDRRGFVLLGRGWQDSRGSNEERGAAIEAGWDVMPFEALRYDDAALYWYGRAYLVGKGYALDYLQGLRAAREPGAIAADMGLTK